MIYGEECPHFFDDHCYLYEGAIQVESHQFCHLIKEKNYDYDRVYKNYRMYSWRDCGRYFDFENAKKHFDRKIRTREDIESDLEFKKEERVSLWEKALAAERYALETGYGQEERFKTYNGAKYADKQLLELEKELERYDSDPIAYQKEQNCNLEDEKRNFERVERTEQGWKWYKDGKCPRDGGKYKGFFSKKCEICGRNEYNYYDDSDIEELLSRQIYD